MWLLNSNWPVEGVDGRDFPPTEHPNMYRCDWARAVMGKSHPVVHTLFRQANTGHKMTNPLKWPRKLSVFLRGIQLPLAPIILPSHVLKPAPEIMDITGYNQFSPIMFGAGERWMGVPYVHWHGAPPDRLKMRAKRLCQITCLPFVSGNNAWTGNCR